MTPEPLTCDLCLHSDRDVEHTWARFTEPVEGQHFGTLNRCKDRDACHRRTELAGRQWTVADGKGIAA